MDAQCIGRGDRSIQVRVLHLDESVQSFHLSINATGEELYANVVDRLQLLESDYFDLAGTDSDGLSFWIERDKPLTRQVEPGKDLLFRFEVKFYTPHPNLLEESYTRYLFALQIKRDLISGVLLCSENTTALLGAYIVQAEIGDFIEEEYQTIDYLKQLRIMHHPTPVRLRRVMEFHKMLIGMSPSESDFNLLDTARKVEYYGLQLHFVKDEEGRGLYISVGHAGLVVYQDYFRLNNFAWPLISKISFKHKHLSVKLHPGSFDKLDFIFDSRDECKRFWRLCIEHHTFFRCARTPSDKPDTESADATKLSNVKTNNRLGARLRRASSTGLRSANSSSTLYRYPNRTQQELVEFVQKHSERRLEFHRPTLGRRANSTLAFNTPSNRARSSRLNRISNASLDVSSRRSKSAVDPGRGYPSSISLTGMLKRTQSGGDRRQKEVACTSTTAPTTITGGINSYLRYADENDFAFTAEVMREVNQRLGFEALLVPTSGYGSAEASSSTGHREISDSASDDQDEEGDDHGDDNQHRQTMGPRRHATLDWTNQVTTGPNHQLEINRKAAASLSRLNTELAELLTARAQAAGLVPLDDNFVLTMRTAQGRLINDDQAYTCGQQPDLIGDDLWSSSQQQPSLSTFYSSSTKPPRRSASQAINPPQSQLQPLVHFPSQALLSTTAISVPTSASVTEDQVKVDVDQGVVPTLSSESTIIDTKHSISASITNQQDQFIQEGETGHSLSDLQQQAPTTSMVVAEPSATAELSSEGGQFQAGESPSSDYRQPPGLFILPSMIEGHHQYGIEITLNGGAVSVSNEDQPVMLSSSSDPTVIDPNQNYTVVYTEPTQLSLVEEEVVIASNQLQPQQQSPAIDDAQSLLTMQSTILPPSSTSRHTTEELGPLSAPRSVEHIYGQVFVENSLAGQSDQFPTLFDRSSHNKSSPSIVSTSQQLGQRRHQSQTFLGSITHQAQSIAQSTPPFKVATTVSAGTQTTAPGGLEGASPKPAPQVTKAPSGPTRYWSSSGSDSNGGAAIALGSSQFRASDPLGVSRRSVSTQHQSDPTNTVTVESQQEDVLVKVKRCPDQLIADSSQFGEVEGREEEEEAYIVVRRPRKHRSVDARQYQLHLRRRLRQQEQSKALAALAANSSSCYQDQHPSTPFYDPQMLAAIYHQHHNQAVEAPLRRHRTTGQEALPPHRQQHAQHYDQEEVVHSRRRHHHDHYHYSQLDDPGQRSHHHRPFPSQMMDQLPTPDDQLGRVKRKAKRRLPQKSAVADGTPIDPTIPVNPSQKPSTAAISSPTLPLQSSTSRNPFPSPSLNPRDPVSVHHHHHCPQHRSTTSGQQQATATKLHRRPKTVESVVTSRSAGDRNSLSQPSSSRRLDSRTSDARRADGNERSGRSPSQQHRKHHPACTSLAGRHHRYPMPGAGLQQQSPSATDGHQRRDAKEQSTTRQPVAKEQTRIKQPRDATIRQLKHELRSAGFYVSEHSSFGLNDDDASLMGGHQQARRVARKVDAVKQRRDDDRQGTRPGEDVHQPTRLLDSERQLSSTNFAVAASTPEKTAAQLESPPLLTDLPPRNSVYLDSDYSDSCHQPAAIAVDKKSVESKSTVAALQFHQSPISSQYGSNSLLDVQQNQAPMTAETDSTLTAPLDQPPPPPQATRAYYSSSSSRSSSHSSYEGIDDTRWCWCNHRHCSYCQSHAPVHSYTSRRHRRPHSHHSSHWQRQQYSRTGSSRRRRPYYRPVSSGGDPRSHHWYRRSYNHRFQRPVNWSPSSQLSLSDSCTELDSATDDHQRRRHGQDNTASLRRHERRLEVELERLSQLTRRLAEAKQQTHSRLAQLTSSKESTGQGRELGIQVEPDELIGVDPQLSSSVRPSPTVDASTETVAEGNEKVNEEKKQVPVEDVASPAPSDDLVIANNAALQCEVFDLNELDHHGEETDEAQEALAQLDAALASPSTPPVTTTSVDSSAPPVGERLSTLVAIGGDGECCDELDVDGTKTITADDGQPVSSIHQQASVDQPPQPPDQPPPINFGMGDGDRPSISSTSSSQLTRLHSPRPFYESIVTTGENPLTGSPLTTFIGSRRSADGDGDADYNGTSKMFTLRSSPTGRSNSTPCSLLPTDLEAIYEDHRHDYETSSTSSEGSEDIEPFPPPPSESELMAQCIAQGKEQVGKEPMPPLTVVTTAANSLSLPETIEEHHGEEEEEEEETSLASSCCTMIQAGESGEIDHLLNTPTRTSPSPEQQQQLIVGEEGETVSTQHTNATPNSFSIPESEQQIDCEVPPEATSLEVEKIDGDSSAATVVVEDNVNQISPDASSTLTQQPDTINPTVVCMEETVDEPLPSAEMEETADTQVADVIVDIDTEDQVDRQESVEYVEIDHVLQQSDNFQDADNGTTVTTVEDDIVVVGDLVNDSGYEVVDTGNAATNEVGNLANQVIEDIVDALTHGQAQNGQSSIEDEI